MKARYLLFLLFVMVSAIKVRATDTNWDYNPYAFRYDMAVYVSLSTIDNKIITDVADYEIGAFCNDECRGIAENKTVGEHKYIYLRVRSNKVTGETISFKIKNRTSGRIAIANETIEFKNEQSIGFPSSPFSVNARNFYSVTFMINGIEHRSDLLFGDVITVPTDISKEGYTFVKWNPDVDATVPDHDVTYTATYTINQYTITFDTDGGSEIAPITQDYNSAVTAPADPTKTGYTFAGWDKEIPATIPAEDITIKALWTINQYTITFDTDGGSEIAPITQDYNSAVTAPADPTKTGYTFAGWDKEIPATIPAEDITIKALWTINQYTITFDTDGGSEIAPITQDYNSAVTAPADPTKTGYTFAGWDKEIPATIPAEDITIKALWTINKYVLTYKVDGEVYKQYEVEYNATITPEVAPLKEGHTFSGWSEIPTTMPAHDVEITGSFSINQYKVTFISEGVIISENTLDFGSPISIPEDPAKIGHTFAGWNPVVDSTVPAHDVTYEAMFENNTYKLIYYVNGEVYKEFEIEYGAEIVPEENPVKEGYDFSGWSEIPQFMPDHDVDVYGTFTVSTGINNVKSISGEERIYNLSGNVILHTRKGINIINGKKVLIK